MFEPEYPETIDRIAEDLVETIARPIQIADAEQTVTASIGIARPEFDCDSIDMLIRRADIAARIQISSRTTRRRAPHFKHERKIGRIYCAVGVDVATRRCNRSDGDRVGGGHPCTPEQATVARI